MMRQVCLALLLVSVVHGITYGSLEQAVLDDPSNADFVADYQAGVGAWVEDKFANGFTETRALIDSLTAEQRRECKGNEDIFAMYSDKFDQWLANMMLRRALMYIPGDLIDKRSVMSLQNCANMVGSGHDVAGELRAINDEFKRTWKKRPKYKAMSWAYIVDAYNGNANGALPPADGYNEFISFYHNYNGPTTFDMIPNINNADDALPLNSQKSKCFFTSMRLRVAYHAQAVFLYGTDDPGNFMHAYFKPFTTADLDVINGQLGHSFSTIVEYQQWLNLVVKGFMEGNKELTKDWQNWAKFHTKGGPQLLSAMPSHSDNVEDVAKMVNGFVKTVMVFKAIMGLFQLLYSVHIVVILLVIVFFFTCCCFCCCCCCCKPCRGNDPPPAPVQGWSEPAQPIQQPMAPMQPQQPAYNPYEAPPPQPQMQGGFNFNMVNNNTNTNR